MREFQNGVSNLRQAFYLNLRKRIEKKRKSIKRYRCPARVLVRCSLCASIGLFFLSRGRHLHLSNHRCAVVVVVVFLPRKRAEERRKKSKQTNDDQFLEQYIYDHDFSELSRGTERIQDLRPLSSKCSRLANKRPLLSLRYACVFFCLSRI